MEVFSQEIELVDIKPIYKSYNFQLLVPLIMLILSLVLLLVFKLIKAFRNKKVKVENYIDWHKIIQLIKEDNSLTPRQIESALIKTMKLYLNDSFCIKATSMLDHEIIDAIEKNKEMRKDQKVKLLELISGSIEFRFADSSLQKELASERIIQLQKILTQENSSQMEGR